MTASDKLRQMVSEATPGPWTTIDARIGNRAWVQVGPTRNRTVTADVANLADANLIALAPQLAELVADMGEALEVILAPWEKTRGQQGPLAIAADKALAPARAVLTRLDVLFEKETA